MSAYLIKTASGEIGPYTAATMPAHGLDRTTLVRRPDSTTWLALECYNELLPIAERMVAMGATHWGPFKRDHITTPGFRQYSSILWDIPWGQDWEDTCYAMPATINGIYFAAPTRCVNNGMMWGEFDVPEMPNALVFINPNIPLNAGHIGWAFKLSNGNYTYGSKEIAGQISVPNGEPNGMFVKTASFEQMKTDMKAGGTQGPSKHPIFQYMSFKQLFTADADPAAARTAADAAFNDGYGLFGNNCMDNAYRVLKAYGLSDEALPNPGHLPNWVPNSWYSQIKAPAEPL